MPYQSRRRRTHDRLYIIITHNNHHAIMDYGNNEYHNMEPWGV